MTVHISKQMPIALPPVRLAFSSISDDIQTYVAFFINQQERIINKIICLDIRKLILIFLAKPLIMKICRANCLGYIYAPNIHNVLICPLKITWLSLWQSIYDQCDIKVKALHYYYDNEINRQCPRSDESLRRFFCTMYDAYTIYSYEEYGWHCELCSFRNNDSFLDYTCLICGHTKIIRCWISACSRQSPCYTMQWHGFIHNEHNIQPNYKTNKHDSEKKARYGIQLHETDTVAWNDVICGFIRKVLPGIVIFWLESLPF